jgi:hypothetical protein
VPAPGAVNVPTGVIVVLSCGAGTGLIPILIVSVALFAEGTCWSDVSAETVTGIVPLALAATDVLTVIVG